MATAKQKGENINKKKCETLKLSFKWMLRWYCFVLLFPGGCKHNKTLMYCSHDSYENKDIICKTTHYKCSFKKKHNVFGAIKLKLYISMHKTIGIYVNE